MIQNRVKSMGRIGLICFILMFLALPGQAFAADTLQIGVQLNGKAIGFTDAAPLNENGRVYVPFRAVFEALDADVDYRAEDGRIMAQKDGVEVIFYVGQSSVTVDNGMVREIGIDAPPFIRDGRTYVPVRFAAQTLGLEVGWDSAVSTVVMLDKAGLKEAAKGQYTLMDRYQKFANAQNTGSTRNVSGSLKLDMQLTDGSGDRARTIPVSGNIKLSGIASADKADMDLQLAFDMEQVKAAMLENGDISATDQAILDALKQADMQVLVDQKTGVAYLKSDLFQTAGKDGAAWYKMQLNSMGIPAQNLSAGSFVSNGSFEANVMQLIDQLTPEHAATCELTLKNLNMYRDDAFQKVGNNYTTSMRQPLNGMASTLSVTLKTNGSMVTGYQETSALYLDNVPLMMVKTDQTGSRTTMDLSINVPDALTMKLTGDVTYTYTSEKPQSVPPYGAVICN